MKAVLPIYLLTFFDEDSGTTVMHTFTTFCYFFPLVGQFFSDPSSLLLLLLIPVFFFFAFFFTFFFSFLFTLFTFSIAFVFFAFSSSAHQGASYLTVTLENTARSCISPSFTAWAMS